MAKISLALPEYDSAVVKLIGQIKKGFDTLDPILGGIQTVTTVHGGTIRQVSDPEIVETEMQRHSANIVLEFDWIRETNVERFTEVIFKFAQELKSQQKKVLFEVLSKTTDSIGNTVDAKGKNIWDAYYEMMEKVELQFDEDGGHNYQIVMHPNMKKKLDENPPTSEQLQRMEDLMASKRQSFYERKRARKLSR